MVDYDWTSAQQQAGSPSTTWTAISQQISQQQQQPMRQQPGCSTFVVNYNLYLLPELG